MSHEERIARLEQARARRRPSRAWLIQQAAITEQEAEGMNATALTSIVRTRQRGEPRLIISNADVEPVKVLRAQFPTAHGWREGSPEEVAMYQRALERFFEEY